MDHNNSHNNHIKQRKRISQNMRNYRERLKKKKLDGN